ncbi:MAG: LacI family DNA-binding transcriptional regulator, partial [Lachnospiraceae bacterium]|nr:LacI family DNA-binding transcriptional regulator [Lachnospiraceae bacterium]
MAYTIRDVSRLAGVSTATVSRTFTAPERVSPKARQSVMEAARILNYQPNAI